MVREYRLEDTSQVLAMMQALWPDEELTEDFSGQQVFVYEQDNGTLGGFIQASIRPYVDGAESTPCPHLEGWFVNEGLRRQGIGRQLVTAVENWARKQGFKELTSDILMENDGSRQAHKALGFVSTEKIEYFRKDLGN